VAPPRLAGTLVLAAVLACLGCGSEEQPGAAAPMGGQGGSKGKGGTGGGVGGMPGTGGNSGGSGGSPGSGGSGGNGGNGGAPGMDTAPGDSAAPDVPTGDGAGNPSGDGGMGGPGDAGPRPDAVGAACATGQSYAFTVRPFTPQTGTFTAYFTVTPGRAPTNSVIGLSDGQKYLHDAYAAIVRFGTSGNLDARNGTAYTSLTPIPYKVTDYHFRLVVNVPARTYAAYVSFEGKPEITIGTDLAFRDTSGMPARLSHWGVEAIAPHVTRVCGFLVQ
jgi:hypothetical protein